MKRYHRDRELLDGGHTPKEFSSFELEQTFYCCISCLIDRLLLVVNRQVSIRLQEKKVIMGEKRHNFKIRKHRCNSIGQSIIDSLTILCFLFFLCVTSRIPSLDLSDVSDSDRPPLPAKNNHQFSARYVKIS